MLDYNRINGESNIMQFSRVLKKYQEQELPSLGSAVIRFKSPTIKKPELPKLKSTKSTVKDSNTAAIEVLALRVDTLVQIMIQQKNPSEATTIESGKSESGKS